MDNNNDTDETVTVDVFPDAVTEIIYLPDSDVSYYLSNERFLDDNPEYEIDTSNLLESDLSDLLLLRNGTYVISTDEEELNENTVILQSSNLQTPSPEEDNDMALDEQFDCMKCNFITNSFETLEAHQEIHQMSACGVCNGVFSDQDLLLRHFKDEHTTYKCVECDLECYGRKSYNSHTRIHESKNFVCHKCNVIFTNSNDLMAHMETHGKLLLYACNKCDEAFSSTYEVSSHLRQVHAIGKPEGRSRKSRRAR